MSRFRKKTRKKPLHLSSAREEKLQDILTTMASASTPASVYTCKCLNVTIHVQTAIGVDAEPTFEIVNPRDFRELNKDHLSQKIFQGSTEVARVKLDISGVRYVS